MGVPAGSCSGRPDPKEDLTSLLAPPAERAFSLTRPEMPWLRKSSGWPRAQMRPPVLITSEVCACRLCWVWWRRAGELVPEPPETRLRPLLAYGISPMFLVTGGPRR